MPSPGHIKPPVQWTLGVHGPEGDHSPQPTYEVKNEWSHTSTALYALMECKETTLLCTLLESQISDIALHQTAALSSSLCLHTGLYFFGR